MEKLVCRYCEIILERNDFCNSCNKPQKDASEVSFTDKTCQRCYKNVFSALNPLSPYCLDCRMDINEKDKEVDRSSNKVSESELNANINFKWLQSWFKWSYKNEKLILSWYEPEFDQKYPPTVEKYKIYGDSITPKIISGEKNYCSFSYDKNMQETIYIKAKIKNGGWLSSKGVVHSLKIKVKT